jgi:hypothetical protein
MMTASMKTECLPYRRLPDFKEKIHSVLRTKLLNASNDEELDWDKEEFEVIPEPRNGCCVEHCTIKLTVPFLDEYI